MGVHYSGVTLDVPLMPPLFTAMKGLSDGKTRRRWVRLQKFFRSVISRVTRNRGRSSSLSGKPGGDTFSFDTSGLRVFYGLALIKSSAM